MRLAPLALLALIAACSDDASSPMDTATAADTDATTVGDTDATADTDATTDSSLPDGDGTSICCPIASPSCDCFATGGSVVDGCTSICDAPPNGWTQITDENGCPKWTGGSSGSCFVPDAGDTSDASEVADGDTGDTGTPYDPWIGLAGSIEVVEYYSTGAGEVSGGHVLVTMNDHVPPALHVMTKEDGACKLWLASTTECPACDEDQSCDAGGTCMPIAEPTSAGTITFGGLVTKMTATPLEPTPYYAIDPDPPGDGLFAAGDTITVDATGAGELAAFSASLTGVSDLAISTIGLVELVDGTSYTLSWTPDGSDATVEVVLQLGWHGRPATGRIICDVPDSAGSVTISADIIAGFPYFGGVGLFQVPSWMERLQRVIVPGAYGPIEVRVASRASLGVSHTAE